MWIDTPQALQDFLATLAGDAFVTIDTEFVRERTYYPQLCVLQVGGSKGAAALDMQALSLDLLKPLLFDTQVLKVLHAAKQDLEIFYLHFNALPTPCFDTQIAASVCGYGDSASYETLVQSLAGSGINKSARFTDWARRPLTPAQLDYALADVTHLRVVYEKLLAKITRSGRATWFSEDMAKLLDATSYAPNPETAYERIRARSKDPKMLSILQQVAAWRERKAMTLDIPRQRVVRDETLVEIAANPPQNDDDFNALRNRFPDKAAWRDEIYACIRDAKAKPLPASALDKDSKNTSHYHGALLDLLAVWLHGVSSKHGVAERLLASKDDLDALLRGADCPVNHGWRYELFGRDAKALLNGELALTVHPKRGLRLVPVAPDSPAAAH